MNPTKDEDVRLQMRALRRERGAAQAQMTGLRETGLDAIRRTAFEPREFKPGHFEREETARRRATTDIAICSLGREAMAAAIGGWRRWSGPIWSLCRRWRAAAR